MDAPRTHRGLPPSCYADASLAPREAEAIFRRCWLFAALTDDLARPNDWVALEVGGVALFVQNFDGDLRAYANRCAHRHARLRVGETGSGPVRCPFHAWMYDRDGVPVGIPGNAEQFGLDRTARQALALERFAVATVGRFVFVRLAADGPDLEDWLGTEVMGRLRHWSEVFTLPVADGRMDWAADWKLGMESVLEVYHVDAVHPESFKAVVAGGWDCATHGPHSTGRSRLTEAATRWWDGVAARLKLAPSPHWRDYDHLTLFPHTAFGLTRGTLMGVQTYLPAGVGRCTLRYRLFLAAGPETKGDGAAVRAVAAHLEPLNRQLLEEDRRAAELVQLNAALAGPDARPALLGAGESRIAHFHDVWRQHLGGAP